MTRPQVLYIGDRHWPEFAGPAQWLKDYVDVSAPPDVAAACRLVLSHDVPFDIVVVAQRRPGEYAQGIFDELRAGAPLTPIVCLLGSFCEGELRTGAPWPGAIRVYAHQFAARMGAQHEHLAGQGATAWAPPFTATEEDRIRASSPVTPPRLAVRAAVISRDRQSASALCDAIQSAGCSPTSHSDDLAAFDDNADIVVWDCAAGFASGTASFDRLVQRLPETPKIVLVGFPRGEDIAAARAHGAAAVISKPFLVEDLLWQVRECLSRFRLPS